MTYHTHCELADYDAKSIKAKTEAEIESVSKKLN